MRRKVEFLMRLFAQTNCKEALMDYLQAEKIITYEQKLKILDAHFSSHPSYIVALLNDLAAVDKLQLVDYEWSILPQERLILTLVSTNNKKTFEYTV